MELAVCQTDLLLPMNPSPCVPCCSTPQVVDVPGSPGLNGADGAAGIDAFTLLTTTLVIPAVAGPVIAPAADIGVAENAWINVGATLFISDGTHWGTFTVTAVGIGTIQLNFENATGDTASQTIAIGGTVAPSGVVGAAATAIVPITSSQAGLAQAITAVYAQVGAVGIVLGATAINYLYLATITVNWTGTTFVASCNIGIRIRNATQATTVATITKPTGIQAAATHPSVDYVVPFTVDNTGVIGDTVQLEVTIDVINSAGTLDVVAGSLCAIPLA